MSLTNPRVSVAVATGVLVVFASLLLMAHDAGAQGHVHVFMQEASQRERFLDFDHDGLRQGDRLASRGPVLDGAQAEQVGSQTAECIVVSKITDGPDGPGGTYRCRYLLRLQGGDVLLEGIDPHGPGVYTLAVIGGTGAYAGALGDATLTDSDEGTDFVINLI